jgi:hypothetical protein
MGKSNETSSYDPFLGRMGSLGDILIPVLIHILSIHTLLKEDLGQPCLRRLLSDPLYEKTLGTYAL